MNFPCSLFSAGAMNKGGSHYAEQIHANLQPKNKDLINILLARAEVGAKKQNSSCPDYPPHVAWPIWIALAGQLLQSGQQ